jgi:vacuolar-type H+-ATPase subunit I/STV1
MATKKQARTGAKKASVEEAAVDADSENVDKIRDILFGNQLRDFNKRFAQLEARMNSDMDLLRNEMRQQFDSLQGYIESEVESLGGRVSSEESTRVQQFDELEDMLKKSARQLEQKLAEQAKLLDKQTSNLNEKLLKQGQDLQQQTTQQLQQVRGLMDNTQHHLAATKLDRTLLAEMFNQVAAQLNQEDQ